MVYIIRNFSQDRRIEDYFDGDSDGDSDSDGENNLQYVDLD